MYVYNHIFNNHIGQTKDNVRLDMNGKPVGHVQMHVCMHRWTEKWQTMLHHQLGDSFTC